MTEQGTGHLGGRYWINTISLAHVRLGVSGGFTQADHGRSTRLKRLSAGDGLVFYSPRTAMHAGTPVQEFTALGKVTGSAPYQIEVSADFHPWRLSVDFLEVRPAPARPLVPDLQFIPDPQRWGLPFRRGLFEIGRTDFFRIAGAMGIDEPTFMTSVPR